MPTALTPFEPLVRRLAVWENETGIGRGKRHAKGVGGFTGTLATRLVRLKPYDPESKGVVQHQWEVLTTVGTCRHLAD